MSISVECLETGKPCETRQDQPVPPGGCPGTDSREKIADDLLNYILPYRQIAGLPAWSLPIGEIREGGVVVVVAGGKGYRYPVYPKGHLFPTRGRVTGTYLGRLGEMGSLGLTGRLAGSFSVPGGSNWDEDVFLPLRDAALIRTGRRIGLPFSAVVPCIRYGPCLVLLLVMQEGRDDSCLLRMDQLSMVSLCGCCIAGMYLCTMQDHDRQQPWFF